MGKLGEYDTIIRDQLAEGVVEPAPLQVTGKEFYMPHRAVIRETAETTKMRVVYDCSARGAKEAPSLNNCLEPGPALQNKIYDVLVHGRFSGLRWRHAPGIFTGSHQRRGARCTEVPLVA